MNESRKKRSARGMRDGAVESAIGIGMGKTRGRRQRGWAKRAERFWEGERDVKRGWRFLSCGGRLDLHCFVNRRSRRDGWCCHCCRGCCGRTSTSITNSSDGNNTPTAVFPRNLSDGRCGVRSLDLWASCQHRVDDDAAVEAPAGGELDSRDDAHGQS
jgi:hypothetical protein